MVSPPDDKDRTPPKWECHRCKGLEYRLGTIVMVHRMPSPLSHDPGHFFLLKNCPAKFPRSQALSRCTTGSIVVPEGAAKSEAGLSCVQLWGRNWEGLGQHWFLYCRKPHLYQHGEHPTIGLFRPDNGPHVVYHFRKFVPNEMIVGGQADIQQSEAVIHQLCSRGVVWSLHTDPRTH